MMEQYKRAIHTNMASAERDLKSNEDRRGFLIGAALQLWETYHDKKRITEQQFDQLIALLSGFAQGTYKSFIEDMVKQYKSGNPPTIIGY